MSFLIYTLSHPETGEVRYVGKTTQGLKKRLNGHMKKAKEAIRIGKNNRHLINWINSLPSEPVIEDIEGCSNDQELKEAEIFYISYFRFLGIRLVNATEGGEGTVGYKHTEETKKKIATASTGRLHTTEAKKKLSIAHTGKKLLDSTKVKLSEINMGKKLSEEAKAKMSVSLKGHIVTQETREKISQAHASGSFNEHYKNMLGKQYSLGYKHTEKAKKKISISSSNISPEMKIQISRKMGGKPFVDQFGNRYETLGEAVRLHGLDKGAVSKVLKGRAAHSKGFVFNYIESQS